MPRVTFINSRNESITLGNDKGYSGKYFMQEVTGLGDLEAINNSIKSPYQDGTTPIDTLLGERILALRAILIANTRAELPQLRQELSRICNPKHGELEIIYEDDFQTKKIKGKADSIPVFPAGKESRTGFIQHASISITCHDPFWKEPGSDPYASYSNEFAYPMQMPNQVQISDIATTITNSGDVETSIIIELSGAITNPRITNQTTGAYIQINRIIATGETLRIITDDQSRKAEIYSNGEFIENATGYIAYESDFWKLEIGDNQIVYSGDNGLETSQATIGWQANYVGI